MTTFARMIEDSVAEHGGRIQTMHLCYPRFIHAEFMTHRVMSRNASSSRAIPVNKMIERTLADPAFFDHVGKNQAGMQAKEEVSDEIKAKFHAEWNELATISAGYVDRWANEYGIHKQCANRAIETWQHIHVLATFTDDENFYDLRDHPDAQPEFQVLAKAMRVAKYTSAPVIRPNDRQTSYGWHLPYVTMEERIAFFDKPELLAKLSAARCARVSYMTHDGRTPNMEEDLALYERLVGGVPLHASPIEHQAYPLPLRSQRSKNFTGWRQHRELVEHQFANQPV